MRMFAKYLLHKRQIIAVYCAFCLIFLVIFLMYHLPAGAVLYPAGLCALLGLVLMALDFRRVMHRHAALSRISSISDTDGFAFPSADSVTEEDLIGIIRMMRGEHAEYRSATNRRYSDMIDYYTVWAHQIKTPIASMRLNLQNEDSALSRKLSSDLFRIEQYADMVLAFLRLDSDSTDYLIQEYNLDGIVRQAVKKFAGEFIIRKLTLNYAPLNTSVITDEKWLVFVIEQILSNALKYTPSGSITISLEQEKKLCIRDTGIGISPDDLPRIFENGYTGRNGRSDKRASGIGLHLCRRICGRLGHGISAMSVVGAGTVITIDFAQTRLEAE